MRGGDIGSCVIRTPAALDTALAMAAKVLETAHGGNPQLSKISALIERQVAAQLGAPATDGQ